MNQNISINELAKTIYKANRAKGFWDIMAKHIDEPEIIDLLVATKISLMHSELSEALEAHRKSLKDNHLTDYDGLVVELADTLIRILDLCGAFDMPIGEVIEKKLAYNTSRPHKHGNNKY